MTSEIALDQNWNIIRGAEAEALISARREIRADLTHLDAQYASVFPCPEDAPGIDHYFPEYSWFEEKLDALYPADIDDGGLYQFELGELGIYACQRELDATKAQLALDVLSYALDLDACVLDGDPDVGWWGGRFLARLAAKAGAV